MAGPGRVLPRTASISGVSEHRSLVRSASLITVITLFSRISGLVRVQRIAALLGASTESDAFIIAFRIPNLLRRLVGEGAVGAAFIPTFTQYLQSAGRKEAFRFANVLLTILTLGMAVVVVLGIVLSPWLVLLLSSGFEDTPGKLELAAYLTRIIFPYIFFVSLAAVAMGILNSVDRFAASAVAPVLLNLSIIGFSFLTGYFSSPEIALSVGVVVGGVAQAGIQIPHLLSSGWRFRPSLDWRHPGVQKVLKLMGPVLLGVGVFQINIIVGSEFASYMVEGAVTALEFSDRVMELVLGGYAIAIATAILPLMSRQADAGQMDEMKRTLNFASRIVLFITIPAAVGLILLRVPIVQVLFEHGDFDAADTALTVWPLLFYALGLPALAIVKIIVPAFYSMQDTRTPVQIAAIAMVLNVVFNFLFFGPLQVGGPAFATSLAAVFNAVALMVIFSRREGALGARSILRSLVRFALASVVLGVVAYTLINRPGFYFDQLFARQVLALAITIVVAALAYFGVAAMLGCPEIGELRAVFARSRKEDNG